jgi:hypothetical protein
MSHSQVVDCAVYKAANPTTAHNHRGTIAGIPILLPSYSTSNKGSYHRGIACGKTKISQIYSAGEMMAPAHRCKSN